ncbi:MAG: RNHCP domain-containing protein [Candidatus Paceibacterota bacterium]|jgi:hypothetical protein
MPKQFQKNIEDLKCENCGKFVVGNGYTNHCPICLWSKHVDINPGDRLATCQGLMKPVGAEIGGGEENIVHECVKCGFVRKNKLCRGDDYKTFIAISIVRK